MQFTQSQKDVIYAAMKSIRESETVASRVREEAELLDAEHFNKYAFISDVEDIMEMMNLQ